MLQHVLLFIWWFQYSELSANSIIIISFFRPYECYIVILDALSRSHITQVKQQLHIFSDVCEYSTKLINGEQPTKLCTT